MSQAAEKDNSADHHEVITHDVGAAVQLAEDVDGVRHSPWAPHMFRLYAVLIIPYLNGCLNGYDGSLMGGLNGMTSYQKYFNM